VHGFAAFNFSYKALAVLIEVNFMERAANGKARMPGFLMQFKNGRPGVRLC
jgi:hypothetical protein